MSGPRTLDGLTAALRRRLQAGGVDDAAAEARHLVREALGLSLTELVRDGGTAVAAETAERLLGYGERRAAGEPIGRILGRRAFHGLTLSLGPETLEPRPDTEVLVDRAVGLVRQGAVPGAAADGTGLVFADIGTGSGAIGLAMLAMLPGARGILTDLSEGALAVAEGNARRLGLADRAAFRAGRYLEPIGERPGLIVSNPPYIASATIATLDREVRAHDPRLALDGGADGLDAYRVLAPGAAERLAPGGWLVVEIGFDQGAAVAGLFAAAGLGRTAVRPDLGGRDRLVEGRRPGLSAGDENWTWKKPSESLG